MTVACTQCAAQQTRTCAYCDAPLCDAHMHLGHPLISARQLASITASTALRNPVLAKDLLLKELPKVAYCAPCRTQVLARRQAEQLKFMLGVLLIIGVICSMVLLMQFVY